MLKNTPKPSHASICSLLNTDNESIHENAEKAGMFHRYFLSIFETEDTSVYMHPLDPIARLESNKELGLYLI